MICQKCNFQNEESATFCRKCGNKLMVSNPYMGTNNNPNVVYSPPPEKPKSKRNIFGIVGFALSVGVAIYIYLGGCIGGGYNGHYDYYYEEMHKVILFPSALLGLIFSCIAFFKKDEKIKDLAAIGLCICLVAWFMIIFINYTGVL